MCIIYSNYNSLVGRVLHFSALPETMRVIYISHYRFNPSIDAIDINYDGLPLSLKQLVITSSSNSERRKLTNRVNARGQVAHVRLEIGAGQAKPKLASTYLDEYDKKVVQRKNRSIS